ncbi:uncharacterized protein METZ01_LOCUS210190 [marine metagenome]|uniref:Uncharacterized protein n=1 Tax=marine metagenome TaxID=408172 RepID=A0A382F2W5_9ZZZZ
MEKLEKEKVLRGGETGKRDPLLVENL